MIGKIHLKGAMQGFDYWEVLPGQGKYWNPEFVTADGRTTYKDEHSTDIITKRAMNWLKNDRDQEKPFMLMVHYKAPHELGYQQRAGKKNSKNEFPRARYSF